MDQYYKKDAAGNLIPLPEGVLHRPSGDENPYGPEIGFRKFGASTPALQYIEVDDILQLSVWSLAAAAVVNLSARILRADGVIVPVFLQAAPASSASVAVTATQRGLAGYILSATASSSAVTQGAVYVTLEIIRGAGSGDATRGTLLLAGTPNAYADICYPTMPPRLPEDQKGLAQHITVTNPAAGAEWLTTVPAGQHWLLKSVRAILTTSGAAPFRLGTLLIDDGTHICGQYSGASATNSLPSTTSIFTWAHGSGGTVGTVGSQPSIINNPLSIDQRLYPGFRISTKTYQLDAADQWSAIVIAAEVAFGL